MSLYDNLLNDPRVNFPTSTDMAERIAGMRRMFKMIGGPPSEGFDPQKAKPGALSSYGLQNPFGGALRRQNSMPPRVPTPDVRPSLAGSGGDTSGDIKTLVRATANMAGITDPYGTINDNSKVASTTSAVDRAIQALKDAAAQHRQQGTSGANGAPLAGPAYKPRYMTPLEGPDTGAVNPNYPGAGIPSRYFMDLRNPEGTAKNYNAVNPITGAAGPGQFLPGTWGDLMKRHPELGLTWQGFQHPSDFPQQHDAALSAYTGESVDKLKAAGITPTEGSLYALHLLGHTGGLNLVSNPDKLVSDLVSPDVIAANPMLKPYVNQPASSLISHFNDIMGGDNG